MLDYVNIENKSYQQGRINKKLAFKDLYFEESGSNGNFSKFSILHREDEVKDGIIFMNGRSLLYKQSARKIFQEENKEISSSRINRFCDKHSIKKYEYWMPTVYLFFDSKYFRSRVTIIYDRTYFPTLTNLYSGSRLLEEDVIPQEITNFIREKKLSLNDICIGNAFQYISLNNGQSLIYEIAKKITTFVYTIFSAKSNNDLALRGPFASICPIELPIFLTYLHRKIKDEKLLKYWYANNLNELYRLRDEYGDTDW